MPLLKLSSSDANKNLRSDRACRWPDGRANGARLEGFVSVTLKPKFQFSSSDKIFTIGSCFAREIEKYMSNLGFYLPAMQIELPESERASSTANDMLNKYSVHSMENELRWAFYGNQIVPENFYIRAKDDLWHDPQMVPNLTPTSLARVSERREITTTLFKRLPECKVIVITLGLAEAWFDIKNSLYLNGPPTQEAISLERDRFRLDVLSYNDIFQSLNNIYQILTEHGHPHFNLLITVSPVPFKATFTSKDALIANTYSKSVQRAAAEAFALLHPNVDYFPSYEIVMLSDRKLAYELDNIHVTKSLVGHIMATVVKYYCPMLQLHQSEVPEAAIAKTRLAVSTSTVLKARGKEALGSKDYDAAVTAFSSLLFRFSEEMTTEEQFEARLNLGVAMLRAKLTKEGVKQLILAKNLLPNHPRATYKLGLGYARVKMNDEALAMFKEACRLNPNERDYHWRLGVQLINMGLISESLSSIQKALIIDPNHQESLEILEKYA